MSVLPRLLSLNITILPSTIDTCAVLLQGERMTGTCLQMNQFRRVDIIGSWVADYWEISLLFRLQTRAVKNGLAVFIDLAEDKRMLL